MSYTSYCHSHHTLPDLFLLQKPRTQLYVWLPAIPMAEVHALLLYLRQNLLQYLHILNGPDIADPMVEDDATRPTTPHR